MHSSCVRQVFSLLTISAFFLGCAQPLTTREKGVLVGGGLGAATGALIGSATGSPGAGAAIGGAVGGLGGGLVGDQLQQRDQILTEQQRTIEEQRRELARNRQLLEELRQRNLEAHETERGVVVNLPDVLFEFGSTILTSTARVKTQDIAHILLTQASDRRVSVEGHTDSIGSDELNQTLSARRAESVTLALEQAGISQQRITTRGFGERYPVAPNTNPDGTDNPSGRERNRRVEVIIENS